MHSDRSAEGPTHVTAGVPAVYRRGAVARTEPGTKREFDAEGGRLPEVASYQPRTKDEMSPIGTGKLIAFGLAIIVLFFGVGLIWASVAPLSSAALAPGVVSVAGSHRLVQHLEGGIVRAIHVAEGDAVKAGQVLVELDDTAARGNIELLHSQQIAALALEARLRAEVDDQERIRFPAALLERMHEPEVREATDGQQGIFESRRRSLLAEVQLLEQRLTQKQDEVRGLTLGVAAVERESSLLLQEIGMLRSLVEKKLATQTRLLALQREEARLDATRIDLETRIAVVSGAMQEVLRQITDIRAKRHEQAVVQLQTVQDRLLEIEKKIPAAESGLTRSVLRAPIDGRVVNLEAHTEGGVIAPGAAVMRVVPVDDRLVIEAHLDPKDRDVVHSGQRAEIRFSAFNQREAVPVKGRVVWISADRIIEPITGIGHYLARIELLEDPAAALNGASVYPGMQANVMIVTGERTALSYLFRPLVRSFNNAFRED